MTYIQWYKSMNDAGWHYKAKFVGADMGKPLHAQITDDEWVHFWRHESATKADGTPITIDEDCAELHWRAGTTPPPL